MRPWGDACLATTLRFTDAHAGVATIACADGSRTVHTTSDAGGNWSVDASAGTGPALPGSDTVSSLSVFVRDQSGAGALWRLYHDALVRSTDGGRRWTRVDLPPLPRVLTTRYAAARQLLDIAFADDRQGWIVGVDGIVLATNDGGLTWQRQTSGTRMDLQAVAAAGPRAAWLAGRQGTVLVSATGGW